MMKLTRTHVNKHLASRFSVIASEAKQSPIRYSLLICVILLLNSLLPFTNAIAAPPLDNPEPGEIRLVAQDEGGQVELKEDQVLVIGLESNPSTGYMWEVEETDGRILRQMGKIEFENQRISESATRLLGAPVEQILRFEAVAAGQTTLKLVYHRPWEKDVKPARTFSIQVQGVGPFTDVKSPTPTVRLSAHDEAPTAEPPILHSPLGLPSAYNWCDQGGCTPVKDQLNCGSCWAFSTVGALESNIKIHDGAVKDLSEQYLLSCNTDGWSCRGGWWAHDYHWNKSSELEAGAVYETAFPYVARDDPCKSSLTHYEKIDSWTYVGPEEGVPSVAAIKQAILDHGPVSVAVCVGSAFQSYSSGVFETNEYCGGDVNHAVVLVGWDDNQGTNGIWHLKNSWGPGWGENGYMRIGYGISNVGYSALAYWHWIASEDLCGYDFGGVLINSTVVDVYDLCSSTNTGGWVKHVVNLSAYAGQSVSLQIRAETDDSLNSNLFVDDVSFQASASSAKNSPTLFDLTNAMPKSGKTIPRDVEKEKGTDREFLLRPQSRTTNEKVQGKHKK